MKTIPKIKWLDSPEEHDYPAAYSYLRLTYTYSFVYRLIDDLRQSNIILFKAKDIFRASGLSLLGVSNSHVVKNTEKIKDGVLLSPLLLVGDARTGKVIIADGYHRLCSIYILNEDAIIPCKIAYIKVET